MSSAANLPLHLRASFEVAALLLATAAVAFIDQTTGITWSMLVLYLIPVGATETA